ncbi:hypothetical protein SAMN05444487_102101 [Marininema mesophilum]|uniref:Ribosomal processing cysteine protease Prp n=1 Tax=Marininema mesophilum TaxID=1048340 RepID=A0A1H2S6J1_9BACL|nr:ribosomal-processing cysteine protease Prp [Marininema mesophilum]SDW26599.1 hypothetical protein SAMN05444487_102101 [Marininema mesophilum]
MIQVTITRDSQGRLERVVMDGHADFGEYGRDIVCAAVSGVAIGLANATEKLLGVRIHGDADEVSGGHLECQLPKGLAPDVEERVRLLMEAMATSLQSIADEYRSFVKVTENTL